MESRKRLPCPERLRRVPPQFSWIDHRLVREERLAGHSHAAWALYLFLVTVADAQGVSYYSDRSLRRRLDMSEELLRSTRSALVQAGLIAYAAPWYQVLSLDRLPNGGARGNSSGEAVSVGEVLCELLRQGGAQ